MNCPLCDQPINPGQRRVTWFTKDDTHETTDAGAIHVSCLKPLSTVTYKQ